MKLLIDYRIEHANGANVGHGIFTFDDLEEGERPSAETMKSVRQEILLDFQRRFPRVRASIDGVVFLNIFEVS